MCTIGKFGQGLHVYHVHVCFNKLTIVVCVCSYLVMDDNYGIATCMT